MMKNTWRVPVLGILIVLLTVLTYLPTLRAGFIWDDNVLITENRIVNARDGLYRSWLTTEAPDYYPLTWSLWWLEWGSWGRNPAGYHVLNMLLHAGNAVLVWLVLRKLKVPGAWLAAAVFAVHPVNVATVAWISEQKNTLSMLFFLIAILSYLKFDEEGGWRWYGLSLMSFLLALFSKTAVVMLPIVLLGCVWWRHGKVRRIDWLCSMPFFAFSMGLGLLTVWFQSHRALEGTVVRTEGFASRLAGAGWVPWFYLYKAVLPIDLTVIYPKWEIDSTHWISYAPGLILLACFAVLWRNRKSWGRPLLFGLGYFVVMLFPVLGFFDQGFYQYALVADHWQYHSIIGVIALVVAGWKQMWPPVRESPWNWGAGISAAVLLLLAAATWKRACVYKDDETLWRDNVTRNPNAWTYNNLGNGLIHAGKFEAAIWNLEQALRIRPDLDVAHYNYGVALKGAGRTQEEIGQYEAALRINPDYADAHYNLGLALWEAGNTEGAMTHWQQALRIKPNLPEVHNNMGAALERSGKLEDAVWHYEQALRVEPHSVKAHRNLGNAFMQLGRVQEAIMHYEETVQLKPDSAEACNDLGVALWRAGRYREAINRYEQALRIKPEYVEAHYNLGGTLEQEGRVQEAIAHYEQALRIKPNFAEARNRLTQLCGSMNGK